MTCAVRLWAPAGLLTHRFAEQFELQRFPFDWQSLSMTLSCIHPAECECGGPGGTRDAGAGFVVGGARCRGRKRAARIAACTVVGVEKRLSPLTCRWHGDDGTQPIHTPTCTRTPGVDPSPRLVLSPHMHALNTGPNQEGYISCFPSRSDGKPVQVLLQPVDAATYGGSGISTSGTGSSSSAGAGAGNSNPTEAVLFFRDGFLLRSSWDYRGYSIQHWLSHPSLSGRGKQYRWGSAEGLRRRRVSDCFKRACCHVTARLVVSFIFVVACPD